jgi:hypothetical protein
MTLYVPPALCQEKLIEHETGFYYTIKKGDTLWDLSQRFSDSPWQWPDLWSKNPHITNPHEIYPGQRIRLFLKKGFDVDASQKTAELKKFPELTIPDKPQVYFYYSLINEVGFIRPQAVEASGKIIEAESSKEMLSTNDVVYIKHLANSTFVPGEKYIIYRVLPPIKDPDTNAVVGIQHLFTGVVTILKNKESFAVGRITQGIRKIDFTQFVMPLTPRSRDIPITESLPDLEGKLVASERETGVYGADHVIFINKGSADGVKPGQMYDIFFQKSFSDTSGERIILPPIELGNLIVLLTEETASTCLIVSSRKEIPMHTSVGFIKP